jgi:predicted phosphodiesterase
MRTVVISDLHLATGTDGDLLRQAGFRERLLAALEGVDRIVLLGDVIELRDRPLAEALEIAGPTFDELGAAVGTGEVVIVPGNHDHRLAEDWLERRALDGAGRLGLEQFAEPRDGPVGILARRLGQRVKVSLAYPGLWIRPDVYATHGHYLDRHLTIPTFERLGVAAVERILGIPPGGPDPLAPPGEPEVASVEEYERVQGPVNAFLYALAQAGVGGRRGAANPSARVWAMVSGGETRAAKLRGWLLGSVALPGAVGIANRLGLGPVRSDLSSGAIARAGLSAISEVVERLAIDADHLIFGHTHRRGPMEGEAGWKAKTTSLWNTGSWVHSPSLLGPTAAESPYWPGTMAVVDGEGPPQLRHVLDDLELDELGSSAEAAPPPSAFPP